ncbi:MAG: hypothetical protein WA003_12515 [Desulfuromonadaceae bacterium]
MIDEYTGKRIVSPLDFTTPEKAIIDMLSKQEKTVKESADFLRELASAISSPAYTAADEFLNQPLSAVIDSLGF